ncbi:hypothetical protein P389DRAFT_132817, partial [Cystobasidium minutum MCA 4210]|uniref:uncharacterized protein n=1 Tax=Cystobasidium minutum MCA 4210 TaxID=1397322 RepID=UPI0034CD21AA
ILLDGQKYACESCFKGHRVSKCTHRQTSLRPNKKGRPFTQCKHCRDRRTSASVHTK